MNQLQTLLQDSLLGTGHVENCAIIRRKDASLRASSPGFSLNGSEMEAFIEMFKSPDRTRDIGVDFDGLHYKCIRADKASVYSKQGAVGLIMARTASLIILATYCNQMCPSICIEATEKLADYFREKGK